MLPNSFPPITLPVSDEILFRFSEFLDVMGGGGIAMWLLLGLGLVLWYAMGYRLLHLGFGPVGTSRIRLRKHAKGERKFKLSILESASADIITARLEANSVNGSRKHFIEEVVLDYSNLLKRYSVLIKTIVVVAPLIGLLGTIVGMIETFEALESMTVFSQGSSIAGGISKALFTTQMGLIVGLPGLLIGRILDRRQQIVENEIRQMQILATMQSPSEMRESKNKKRRGSQ